MPASLFTRLVDNVSTLASRVTTTAGELRQLATEMSTSGEPQNTEESVVEGAVEDRELDKSELEVWS